MSVRSLMYCSAVACMHLTREAKTVQKTWAVPRENPPQASLQILLCWLDSFWIWLTASTSHIWPSGTGHLQTASLDISDPHSGPLLRYRATSQAQMHTSEPYAPHTEFSTLSLRMPRLSNSKKSLESNSRRSQVYLTCICRIASAWRDWAAAAEYDPS
jgi:hypothetical protein